MAITTTLNPALGLQWHLTKIFGGRQDQIWSEFTGAGIRVGVFDDGLEKTNADLRGNYNAAGELRINGVAVDPSLGSGVHGTAVAGIIAAQANNGIGGVGVAHGASITGFNVFTGAGAGSNFLTSIRAMSTMDVANNSWGWTARYADPSSASGSFGQLFQAALKTSADVGRGGLGTIIVNAAGNEWQELRDANASQFNASRHTITVGAIGEDGDVAFYSTRGSSVFVSAPSSGGGRGITTTDKTGTAGYSATDVTNSFGGTSAASPIVSAVAALMLDANDKLGWRDVQDILAITADHTTPASLTGPATGRMAFGWTINKADNVNGGGMHYSNDVGFGQVDAFEAVRFAEVWGRFGTAQTSANEQMTSVSGSLNRAIGDSQTIEFKVNVARALEIESAALTLTLTHGNLNDLRIELISPEGTRSVVLNPSTGVSSASNLTWTFATEALRGETSLGNWTVRITDTKTGATGGIASYRLDVFGDAPSVNDVYHYTSEFAKMAALDASRAVLRDTDGGIDWLNAAGATTATVINLNQGSASSIHGRNLTIAAGTVIANAVTGDGNDSLTGNEVGNVLLGMRGDDMLQGLGGADTLDGGLGVDVASYAASTAAVDVSLVRATQVGGHAQGDVLIAIENIVGSSFNDMLAGNAGANRLDGGLGIDFVSYAASTAAVDVNLTRATQIGGHAQGDVLIAIENIVGSNFNDILAGDAGTNRLDGGLGIDSVSYAASTVAVDVNLTRATQIGGHAQGDILIAIENVTGSNFNDSLTGNEVGNILLGMRGDDILQGLGGADTLDGGLGIDVASYAASTAAVDVSLIRATQVGGHAQGDVLIAIEYIVGSSFNDMLAGDAGANRLDGGLGIDSASYAASSVAVDVNLTRATQVGGHAQGDVLIAIENIVGSSFNDLLAGDAGANRLDGGAGNDILRGGGGADVLIGGVGNDTLFGGAGDDSLFGGLGNDIFGFDGRGFGLDTIMDFQDGRDLLDLRGLGLTFASISIVSATDKYLVYAGGGIISVSGAERGFLTASDFLFA